MQYCNWITSVLLLKSIWLIGQVWLIGESIFSNNILLEKRGAPSNRPKEKNWKGLFIHKLFKSEIFQTCEIISYLEKKQKHD